MRRSHFEGVSVKVTLSEHLTSIEAKINEIQVQLCWRFLVLITAVTVITLKLLLLCPKASTAHALTCVNRPPLFYNCWYA